MGAQAQEARTGRLWIIICDTGPIRHLHDADILSVLAEAGEIIIPRKVENEIRPRLPQ